MDIQLWFVCRSQLSSDVDSGKVEHLWPTSLKIQIYWFALDRIITVVFLWRNEAT